MRTDAVLLGKSLGVGIGGARRIAPRIVAIAAVAFGLVGVEPAAGEDRLRVLVWNVWRGGNEVDGGPEKIQAVIESVEPDLVLLQESYDVDGDRPTLGRWVAGRLGWNAHQADSPHLCILAPSEFDATHVHDPWHGVGVRLEDGEGRALLAWSIWLDYRSFVTYALRDDPTLSDDALLEMETKNSSRYEEVTSLLAAVDEVSAGAPELPTLIGGDFNCPSHLDWTVDTARVYRHRRSLDLPVSTAVAEKGFVDVFRVVHPDPVQHPGITWSPMFRENAEGVVQAFDRIDRLYLRNPETPPGTWTLHPIRAAVLPESWEAEEVPVRSRIFPSDHAAIVLDLEWRRERAPEAIPAVTRPRDRTDAPPAGRDGRKSETSGNPSDASS